MQKNFVLKAQKAIKRIAAISTATTMLGATILGAVAAQDLGDYPTPFISESGALNGLVVVGASAQSADVIGAAELVSTLTQAAVTTTPGTSSTTVTGGKLKEVNIGDDLTTDFGTTGLDDKDLSGFQDTTIDFNDNTVDVHDEIIIGSGDVTVHSSLTSGDNDYGDNVAIELEKGGIGYYYVFDESLNLSKASTSDPVEMNFLGKTIKITSVSQGDHDTFTAQVGTEYALNVGDSVTVNGKVITLKDVSSASACTVNIDVDGTTKAISTSTKINGIKVDPDTCFYSDTKADRSASLIIGEDTSKTYDDDDAFIGEDTSNANWVWDISNLNDTDTKGSSICTTTSDLTSGPCIGVINEFVKDDWADAPIQVGESYNLPYDFAKVSFDSLTVSDYVDIEVSVDTSVDLSDANVGGMTFGTSAEALVISSNRQDSIILDYSEFNDTSSNFASDTSTDTVYLVNSVGATGTGHSGAVALMEVFYEDSENHEVYAGNITLEDSRSANIGNFAFVDYRDTTGVGDIQMMIWGNTTQDSFVQLEFQDENADSAGSDLVTNWSLSAADGDFDHLGATADTEEASELVYGTTNIGTKDENQRTHYGMIVYDPKSNGADDKVKLSIPADDLEANVIISGPGTTTSASGGSVNVVSVAGTAVAKLDTEISDATAKNLILVGGPAVNKLSASALGLDFPTYGAASTVPENKGMLKLVSNAFGGSNTALVVAGWTADDTRNAANVLKNYADYSAQLSGKTEVEVSGTTVTAVSSSTNVE